MERPAQPGAATQAELAQALDRLWGRFLPEMRGRVSLLEAAASSLVEGSLTVAQCEAAQSAAHKLAGVLGTFNLTRGTVVARELETCFSREGGPDPDMSNRVADAAQELRAMIESRKSLT